MECFIAVAEELHFGSAANRLRMTQPPLSRQIQQLERELDTVLFVRTSRKVELTTAGSALLPRARQLIDLAAKMAADVRSIGEGASGTLTISYTAMAGLNVLPELIRLIRERLSGVTVLLREMVSTEQLEGLARGTVDLALLRPMVDKPGISWRPVLEEKLVLAAPSEWPLAQAATSTRLSAIENAPFLMYSPGGSRYFHDLLQAMFVEASVQPRIVQYAEQVMALLALVSAGLGCALVPASAVEIASPRVTLIPVADDDPSAVHNCVRLDVAWHDHGVTPLVSSALELVDELALTLRRGVRN
ncbi:MAG: LysR family transcriptional regulator [Mycobacterium sp.]